MAHRRTESLDAVAAMVERFPGVKVTFGITGGSHQVAEITFGDKRRKVFFAQTPSDGNAYCPGYHCCDRPIRREGIG
jgi:hypothetical protein